MAASAVSSHSTSNTGDIASLNSYGSLPRAVDIEVLPATTVLNSSYSDENDDDFRPTRHSRAGRNLCLEPRHSETVFALFLFLFGLGLLIYVIVSTWLAHSQISPVIIFICGLLLFIPGCYYLMEHYCFCLRCQRNRRQCLPILERDDMI